MFVGLNSDWAPVIFGVTRFECQRCGSCCYRAAVEGVEMLPDGEYCPLYDKKTHACTKHDESRKPQCRRFPFRIMLGRPCIFTHCPGYGRGPVVTEEEMKKLFDVT